MKAFVISDIHGKFEHFNELLSNWNTEDTLIILGDMIDRGECSYEVVHKVMELKEKYPDKVIYLMGNHEDMLIQYIDNPYENGRLYYDNGGNKTIESFIKDKEIYYKCFKTNACTFLEKCKDEYEFLKSGLLYYEFGKVLFTHAGFQSIYPDWKRSKDADFIWIRDHYKHENETGLVNVFGHTPTQYMHNSNDVWISKCKSYIGIDGACAYGGQLNGLLINDNGEVLETYSVSNDITSDKI